MRRGPGRLSGSQTRTCSAIIEAAAELLADNHTATLSQIAQAAGVGRTTVHRYFPDRETLVTATIADSVVVVAAAVAAAAPEDGCAITAMRRVITALIPVGHRMSFLFGEPGRTRDTARESLSTARRLSSLIQRGQTAGVFDPGVSSRWIEHALYGLINAAYRDVQNGRMPRHKAVPTVIRTFERGVCARG
ncbi:TetR/AcrR family transcriptional regulator [Mycobacterium sp. DBP42]|uniref:TetR/AcrR family transcriptional regulator n=1 Tax=Mycobacterium sp. DBP42 TaxID=2545267 RepID=UPI00110CC5EB|nr:TetR/AcrR family transcriptional regulator [Mycobacterium sp. DBP42]TMS52425.1 TetR/AcrR family transcriptional regulator [Mycobacterium sp. DBP42]